MAGRIVLYGATGYTGALTAQALVAGGVRLVLAGRDQGRLSALAARLAQADGGTEPETAVVDAERPGPLRDLLGPGDVLVSTAGPFLQVGRPIVAAAVDAGAVYLDSAGEPPFIRQVFEDFGPLAERTGAVLLTAFGYDFVPGNLAGALALDAAGPRAARVRVGYFVSGDLRRSASAGTRASMLGVLLEPGYAFRGGRIVSERTSARVASFTIDGKAREAVSLGAAEHFALPRLRPMAGPATARGSLTLTSTSAGSAVRAEPSATPPCSTRRWAACPARAGRLQPRPGGCSAAGSRLAIPALSARTWWPSRPMPMARSWPRSV